MGTGIAHVLALAGYDVVLEDINKDALAKARATIEKNMQRQAAKGLITEDRDQSRAGAHPRHPNFGDLKDRDLVIEAATEDERSRRRCSRSCARGSIRKTMIATNTSSIPVTRLAAATDRPESFIGLHFMNPVPVMQLVEVIRGIATNDDTFPAALEIVRRSARPPPMPRIFPPSSSTASCCR